MFEVLTESPKNYIRSLSLRIRQVVRNIATVRGVRLYVRLEKSR